MAMKKAVELSPRSLELIKNYVLAYGDEHNSLQTVNSTLKTTELVSWLSSAAMYSDLPTAHSKEEQEFLLTSLRAQLLKDLLSSLNDENKDNLTTNPLLKEAVWANRLKWGLLAGAGTLLAACEGFDSVTTLLGMFTLPTAAILGVGVFFSFLSIIFFYGYDLIQISKNLGVSLKDTPKLLDTCLLELEGIKALRRTIESYNLSLFSPEELMQLNEMSSMLQIRFKEVIATSNQFVLALDSPKMKIAKHILSAVAGLLFFGGGFFAGQSVGAFVAGLIMTTVVPAFWPVLIFSVLVGLAAFSLYWYVERVSVSTLVSSWFGLDEEKIALLSDEPKLKREEQRLLNLNEKVDGFLSISKKNGDQALQDEPLVSPRAVQKLEPTSTPSKAGLNLFFSPKPELSSQEFSISSNLSAAC